MSTTTEPLTDDEKLTLRHAIEDSIRKKRARVDDPCASWSYWAKRLEELRSAAEKLGLKLNEANT